MDCGFLIMSRLLLVTDAPAPNKLPRLKHNPLKLKKKAKDTKVSPEEMDQCGGDYFKTSS